MKSIIKRQSTTHAQISQRALWVRGIPCHADHEKIRYVPLTPKDSSTKVLPKTAAGYDLFDFYYPRGKGPEGQKSVYLEFVDLSNDLSGIVDFLNAYGPLHLAGMLHPTEQDQGPYEKTEALSDIHTAIHTFRTVLLLCQAHHEQREDILKEVKLSPLWVAHEGQWQTLRHPVNLEKIPQQLHLLFLRQLEGLRFEPRWEQASDQWVHYWSIPSLLTIFYYMLFLDLERQGLHRQCPPGDYACGSFFVTWRKGAKYCSDRCQKLAKVRRMRDPARK
ncbi:MAG: hypothetical protein KC643_33790 [Nitrospira sp.]|nr:hypothetical protein [Nitrospira sp.]